MSVTPKMDSAVPCDGQEHTIYTRNRRIDATVFIKYNSTHCKFTARLYTPGPPGGPPNVLEVELVIPVGGGYRAVGGTFQDFAVLCEPPAPGGPQGSGPEAQVSRREPQRAEQIARKPGAVEQCEFEWYVVF